MTLIELLNKIANNEVKDKTKYRIYFEDIEGDKLYRDIYYDQSEPVAMDCLKNISDDYPIYDEIGFTNTIIEEIKEQVMEEIDIIELLKRVKEGKAPKRIEINGNIYNYEEWNTSNIQFMYENNNYNMFVENIGFDTKIKILDKPIIEELKYSLEELEETSYNESWLMNCIRANKEKINEIIRYLRSKDER